MLISRIAAAGFVTLLLASPASADLENLFDCQLKQGKTHEDLFGFMKTYETAAGEAGFDGYNLQIMIPVYADQIGVDRFTWSGSFKDWEQLAAVAAWFPASPWPDKFGELMTCESSTLWQTMD